MSKKRFVDTGFWSDVWVVDELSILERYFFIYLITNEKTNVAGVYEISLRTMANETEFSKDEVQLMLDKMSARVKYVDGWVVMRKGIKNQNYRNEKIKVAIERALIDCPRKALEYIDFPDDFDTQKVLLSLQQAKFPFKNDVDDLATDNGGKMRHRRLMHDPLHSDSDLDTDINLDSDADAGKPPGFKKKYFRAAEADREQTKRAEKADDRKGKGYAKAAAVAETLRQRRAKPA